MTKRSWKILIFKARIFKGLIFKGLGWVVLGGGTLAQSCRLGNAKNLSK
jgi:hypothetical protein